MNNNPSHTNRFEELCAAYVLDALDANERSEFEPMLSEASQDQLETFYSLRSTAHQLAFSTEPATPSEQVEKEIMQFVRGKARGATPEAEQNNQGYSRFALSMAASFALLLITLALIFYSFNLNSQIGNKQNVIKQQKVQISKLKSNIQKKSKMLSILSARSVEMVVMDGLDVNPNGYGKVIWDAEKQQALLQVSNLPAISANKDYQLWLIKNNKPTPAGVFAVNKSSANSFFKIEQLAKASEQNANAFAVTLEPKGGSKQPTGDMYLLGNIPKNTN